MDGKLLGQIGNYADIYRFVAEGSCEIEEVKAHMKSKGVKTTTINSQLGKITGDNPGLFRVNGSYLSVDQERAREVVKEFNEIFAPITKMSSQEYEELKRLKEKNKELKKRLDAYKDKETKRIEKENKVFKATNTLMPKILLVDSVKVGKIEDIRDGVFINSPGTEINVEDFIKKYGRSRDSFYRDLPPEKELTQNNYRKKTLANVFEEKWFGRRFSEMFHLKKVAPKKELSMKEQMMDDFHISKEEAAAQMNYLKGRALSIQEILDDTNLTNQEKLALYAFNSPYRNTDLERLLNYAGDECPDANWLIALLEEPQICNNYENVKSLIRQSMKASEWKMKQRLAEELISGDWYITANYNGVLTKFQLVPVEELNKVRELLGIEAKDFEYELLVTDKEDKIPEEQKAVPKKGDFVKTYEFNPEDNDEADADILSYGEESEEE